MGMMLWNGSSVLKIGLGLACAIAGSLLLTAAISRREPRVNAAVERPATPEAQATHGNRTPVLVELFTSEGCSSCPPADALIAQWSQAQPVAGAEVIALKEHVYYWNDLGWRDPFSSAKFSERQNDYARAFGNAQVYTPQMIVDGREEFVGSNAARAQQAITRAAQSPKLTVQLTWQPSAAPGGGPSLAVRIEQLVASASGDTAEVFLAITEDNLHSNVLRGENAGSRFDHFAVVRELHSIGKADPHAALAFDARTSVNLSSTWKRENLRVVVFAQERRSRHILALAAIAPPGT